MMSSKQMLRVYDQNRARKRLVFCDDEAEGSDILNAVRSKFNVPDSDPVSLVLDIDGCQIETDDLPGVMSLQQPLMILRGTEAWSKEVIQSPSTPSEGPSSSQKADGSGLPLPELQPIPLSPAISTPTTPTPTTSTQPTATAAVSTNIFNCHADFTAYLNDHPKCKDSMQQLAVGNYTILGRRAVTQVAVSKLIDSYDHYVSSSLKQKVAGWLADLTGMKATDYFDPITHKGFLNKQLENRRRKLPPKEKRWVWTKKAKLEADETFSTAASLLEPDDEDVDNLDGCPRHVSECVYCEGASCESRNADLAKLKTLSSTLYRQQLIDAARRTYCFRSQDIAKNLPTFKLCAQSYPCYLSLPQIVLQDFECKFPHAKDSFITTFDGNIVPATIKMAATSRNEEIRALSIMPSGANDMDASIRCIKILMSVLPTPGKTRLSVMESFRKLLCILPPGKSIDMDEMEQDLKCRFCKVESSGRLAGHPFIVQQQGLHGNEASFSVYIDGQLIPVGSSFVEAFDFWFKLSWVFMLAYPCGLNTFLKFVEHKIYNLWEGAGKIQPSINDIARQLKLG